MDGSRMVQLPFGGSIAPRENGGDRFHCWILHHGSSAVCEPRHASNAWGLESHGFSRDGTVEPPAKTTVTASGFPAPS